VWAWKKRLSEQEVANGGGSSLRADCWGGSRNIDKMTTT
jgi:hypothetical protein